MISRRPRQWGAFASTLAVMLITSAAMAQTAAERAASAQVLFDDATKLVAAGRFTEACPKFKSAQDLDPGMATQFRLAECYEKLGKLASAWALYVEVADAAKGEKSAKREALARKRAAAVEPRLSRLTITVPPPVAALEGLTIKRDGIVIDKPLWGMAVPVDPGEHAIAAVAPGKKRWEGVGAAVPEGKSEEVVIPLLVDAPLAVQPSSQTMSVGTDPPPTMQRSVVPAVVMSAGALVAAAAGVTLFVLSNKKQAEAQNIDQQIVQSSTGPTTCLGAMPNALCSNLSRTAKQVDTFRYVSVGAFIGSGVLVAGTLTYLLWPAQRPKKTGIDIHAAPVVSKDQGAVTVWGAF